jgi:protein gp37
MSEHGKIEWPDSTWNAVRGCTKCSPGCKNCYAQTFAEQFRGVVGNPYEQGFDLRLVPEKLTEPLFRTQPRMIFVNSLSDFFHEGIPVECTVWMARVMAIANWHTYQVLTKRSLRMRNLLTSDLRFVANQGHIWWGVSVEDCKYGLLRIEHLRDTPVPVRFLSIEPLLEDLGEINLAGIHLVIVGGESGPKARPMKKEWVVSIRNQCVKAGVPFFLKQWGGTQMKPAGRELDGQSYSAMPARTAAPVMEPADRIAAIAKLKREWLESRRQKS